MHELQLAVNLTGYRIFIRRKQDKAFLPVAKRVYDRDAYTCQYCGFQAQIHQHIVNLDGNYLNNKLSNLATACPFCMQMMEDGVKLNNLGDSVLVKDIAEVIAENLA